MVLANRCHRQNMKTSIINGSEVSRLSVAIHLLNYIECDYNRWRWYSWCGGLSPEQFENQNLT
ncbi:hypothetical protein EQH66_22110 [Escherichia coli]|nr:hypothetical protein EQH66_22110 [Escherichia coli]